MIKIKDIYSFPKTSPRRASGLLRETWIPELPALADASRAACTRLDAERQVEINQVYFSCEDGERTVEMYTVYFEQKPVFIMQQAGRGGCDFDRRFVTDSETYKRLVGYLQSLLAPEINVAYVDPETDMYIDDILNIYGTDVSHHFGRTPERRLHGVMLITDLRGLGAQQKAPYLVVIGPDDDPLPEFVRRGRYVFQLGERLTPDELQFARKQYQTNMEPGVEKCFWVYDAEGNAPKTGVPAI